MDAAAAELNLHLQARLKSAALDFTVWCASCIIIAIHYFPRLAWWSQKKEYRLASENSAAHSGVPYSTGVGTTTTINQVMVRR